MVDFGLISDGRGVSITKEDKTYNLFSTVSIHKEGQCWEVKEEMNILADTVENLIISLTEALQKVFDRLEQDFKKFDKKIKEVEEKVK